MKHYRVGITFFDERGHCLLEDVRAAHPNGQFFTIWYLNGTVEHYPASGIESVAVFDDGEVEEPF